MKLVKIFKICTLFLFAIFLFSGCVNVKGYTPQVDPDIVFLGSRSEFSVYVREGKGGDFELENTQVELISESGQLIRCGVKSISRLNDSLTSVRAFLVDDELKSSKYLLRVYQSDEKVIETDMVVESNFIGPIEVFKAYFFP